MPGDVHIWTRVRPLFECKQRFADDYLVNEDVNIVWDRKVARLGLLHRRWQMKFAANDAWGDLVAIALVAASTNKDQIEHSSVHEFLLRVSDTASLARQTICTFAVLHAAYFKKSLLIRCYARCVSRQEYSCGPEKPPNRVVMPSDFESQVLFPRHVLRMRESTHFLG